MPRIYYLKSPFKISFSSSAVFFLLLVYICGAFSNPVFASSLNSNNPPEIKFDDASALMRHIDRLWRGDTARSTMTMSVKTRRYSRTMTMETWAKGKEHSLIIIKSPKKDKGIATLKVKENIWNYLPKINRVTKVPPSLMSGSWMGSHFTNDDLVKENTYEDDYDSMISFSGRRDNINVIEITSTPKENAAVVWGKIITLIDREKLVPMSSSYYNEENTLVRIMHFSKLEMHDNRLIPMKTTLNPLDKPNESTSFEYHEINFDMPIDDNVFSIQQLKR